MQSVSSLVLLLRDAIPVALCQLADPTRSMPALLSYDLSITVDELRETYEYNETCQRTVPEAFRCFYEATDFEDAIRNAISIGGDSDTLAAITGSIAEAKWGVPEEIREEALGRLDEYLLGIYHRFLARYSSFDMASGASE